MVVVPDTSPTAFEKVDVEVLEVNPASGLTNDVIDAERVSVQCSGRVPGTVGTYCSL